MLQQAISILLEDSFSKDGYGISNNSDDNLDDNCNGDPLHRTLNTSKCFAFVKCLFCVVPAVVMVVFQLMGLKSKSALGINDKFNTRYRLCLFC